MTREEYIEEILGIMDEMTDEAELEHEPEMRTLELTDTYAIAIEADFTVDHIDSWKVYLKEGEEYRENISYHEIQNDIPALKRDIRYLLEYAGI